MDGKNLYYFGISNIVSWRQPLRAMASPDRQAFIVPFSRSKSSKFLRTFKRKLIARYEKRYLKTNKDKLSHPARFSICRHFLRANQAPIPMQAIYKRREFAQELHCKWQSSHRGFFCRSKDQWSG